MYAYIYIYIYTHMRGGPGRLKGKSSMRSYIQMDPDQQHSGLCYILLCYSIICYINVYVIYLLHYTMTLLCVYIYIYTHTYIDTFSEQRTHVREQLRDMSPA